MLTFSLVSLALVAAGAHHNADLVTAAGLLAAARDIWIRPEAGALVVPLEALAWFRSNRLTDLLQPVTLTAAAWLGAGPWLRWMDLDRALGGAAGVFQPPLPPMPDLFDLDPSGGWP